MKQFEPPKTERGLTLVELLVAVALGLITTLIVAQVMINSDAQNRRTTSGTDAQVNGATAMYLLAQNLQSSGYGLIGHSGDRGCPVTWPGATAVSANGTLRLTPVEIIVPASESSKAAGERSVIIRSFSSGSADFAVPRRLSTSTNSVSDGFFVSSTLGLNNDNLLLVSRRDWSGSAAWCLMFTASAIDASTGKIDIGVASSEDDGESGESSTDLIPTGGYRDDTSSLTTMGIWPDIREYQINPATNTLEVRRFDRTSQNWVTETVANNIIRLMAFYGMDDNNDGQVDRYTQTSPTDGASGWARVVNLRVAVVARSGQFEFPALVNGQRQHATPTAPQWQVGASSTTFEGAAPCVTTEDEDGQVTTSLEQCLTITLGPSGADAADDGGGDDGSGAAPPAAANDGTSRDDWRNYRYKVFDTVIPLRNQVWSPT